MPHYSKKSKKILSNAHPGLQKLFAEVIKHFDCRIVCSYRGKAAQALAKETGKSKANFGESPHNYEMAPAIDVVPYPVDWADTDRMQYFAGQVMGIANQMGIDIRWGGDWDNDTHLSNNRFNDLPHFELTNWREIVGI